MSWHFSLQTGSLPATSHVQPAPPNPQPASPQPAAEPIPAPHQTHSPTPTQAPPTLAPAPSPTSAHSPQTPAAPTAPSHTAGHPLRTQASGLNHATSTTDETHPIPTTQFARPEAPAAQPDNPPRIAPSTPQRAPNRDAYGLHFDHNCRLLIDGKPL